MNTSEGQGSGTRKGTPQVAAGHELKPGAASRGPTPGNPRPVRLPEVRPPARIDCCLGNGYEIPARFASRREPENRATPTGPRDRPVLWRKARETSVGCGSPGRIFFEREKVCHISGHIRRWCSRATGTGVESHLGPWLTLIPRRARVPCGYGLPVVAGTVPRSWLAGGSGGGAGLRWRFIWT